MNTQKQTFLIVVMFFMFVGSCAAYAAIDLPVRADDQAKYQHDGSVERGALLFANNCRTCHGNIGQGGVGLPLNTEEYKNQDPLVLKANQDKLRRTLYCGRLGTFMQPWLVTNGGALNAIQIEHLINLITAPAEEDAKDADGNVTSHAWLEAEHFAHNLNHHSTATVGGDTLDTIAKAHGIGPAQLGAAQNPPVARENLSQPLKKGTTVSIPPVKGASKGFKYKILTNNETIAKVAEKVHYGAILLAELNGLNYKLDTKTYLLHLLDDQNRTITGLFPGDKLKLPEGATYAALTGETVQEIADAHGILPGSIQSLNDSIRSIGANVELKVPEGQSAIVLKLPKVDAYLVQGQSLEDVATGYANTTADDFAEANNAPNGDALVRIGTSLKLPEDAWGTAPAGSPNTGTACVEHAVPSRVFEELTGAGGPPAKPAAVSNTVSIVANANDWTLSADGTAQAPNKGVALIKTGTTVQFSVAAGIHTITIDEKPARVPLFSPGDTNSITFSTAGQFEILCDFHPDMYAYLYVE